MFELKDTNVSVCNRRNCGMNKLGTLLDNQIVIDGEFIAYVDIKVRNWFSDCIAIAPCIISTVTSLDHLLNIVVLFTK